MAKHKSPIKWEVLCRRTEDPKLSWIENELNKLMIPHRRNGESAHAPVLEVDQELIEEADSILQRRCGRYTIDDIRDDHPRWDRLRLSDIADNEYDEYANPDAELRSAALDSKGRP